MRRPLRFPVAEVSQANSRLALTFETLAVPPRHELVSSVHGWIFHGDELLLIRPQGQGWTAPGGERRAGETFRETLARTAWETAGALLSAVRMIGAVKVAEQDAPAATLLPHENAPDYQVWFLAEARELLPFSAHFEAHDRMLIDPTLAPRIVAQWNPLMDAMLAYAQAVRAPLHTGALV